MAASAGRQAVVANYFRSDARASASGTPDFPMGTEYMPIGGWLQTAQITKYNIDAR